MYNYQAKIVKVVDGDTIDVEIDLGFDIWHKTRLRFAHIDAYEKTTEIGKQASKFVGDTLSKDTTYQITTYKPDKYGRYLAEIFVDGVSLNKTLVEKKFAVPYEGGKRE